MKVPGQIFYGRLLLALAGGLFCAALSYFNGVQALDRMVYDAFNEAVPLPPAHDIVIVAIDERSLQELGRWPWPREKHVELLRKLLEAGSAAVAIDILFAEEDANYPEVDQLLARAVASHGSVVLPIFIGQTTRGGNLAELGPIASLAKVAASLGHVHIEVDNDGVARRVFLKVGLGENRWTHFSVSLADTLGLPTDKLPGVVDREVLANPDPAAIIRSHENLIPFMGPAGTVKQVSYADVMRGRISGDVLKDKIVFVGAIAAGHADNITTSLGQISGVEVNANIFQALRNKQLIQAASPLLSALIAFMITVMTIWVFTRLAPRQLLMIVLSIAALLPIVSFAVFSIWRYWVSPAPAMLTLLIAYPLWNWLRLDAALGFIHGQLTELERENSAISHNYDWQDVERAANFLQALGHITSWEWGDPVAAALVPEQDKKWRSTATISSKVFTFGEQSRPLKLAWQPEHESTATNLLQIFPGDGAQSSEPGSGADFLNINLFHLDQAYAEAQRNSELIKGTLEQLGSGVILADFSGEILLINERAQSLLHLPGNSKDLLAALAAVELPDGDAMVNLIGNLVASGMHFNREVRTLNGGHDMLCQGGVIGLDKPMLLVVLTDVSELKDSEKQRTEALNFLSHDLRAPLTSVLALIEGAKGEHPQMQKDALLAEIEKYIQRNLSYAENFIQLAKIEHKTPPRFDECDAQSLIDNAVAQLFHAAKKRHIKLRIAYPEDDIWLNCNRDHVERALINLIDNAIKHSVDSSNISITLSSDAQFAMFEISDEGEGIEPQDLDRIFDGFQQGNTARSGVGLGLRFVSAVANSHAGSIVVTNNLTGGSSFLLKISLDAKPA